MSDNQNQGGDPSGQGGDPNASGDAPKTFTQAEVDQLIGKTRTEVRNQVSSKYADYDQLKAAAEGKKTSDDRIAELEKQYAQSQANSLRLRVAGDWGVPTKRGENGEASDADLFLTATDEDTLVAQAKRYNDLMEQQKQNQPHVSREGTNPRPQPNSTQEFLSALTGGGQ
ncbi:hypothetical protein [Williamsia serinedens]|uniref:Scaffolding protein n=1 Tax=Williamsia serinedens TaxID=391736 RepID=A0ABT1H9T1_9NOCA|nr:hypothetical protein [Williamsia serinedens]MCP2162667.1 protein of unknown function (DUF4355) [Williamsia serinedens]